VKKAHKEIVSLAASGKVAPAVDALERARRAAVGDAATLRDLLDAALQVRKLARHPSSQTKAKEAIEAIRRTARYAENAPKKSSAASSTESSGRSRPTTRCGHVALSAGTLSWEIFEESRSSKRLTGGSGFSKRQPAKWGKTVPKSRTVDATTSARVDTSGQLTESRRSTATRAAAGAVIAGPVGAIIGLGAKKRETTDTRRVYLAVDADDWSELFTFGPELEAAARRLAQEINRISRASSR
jgi:hypothetical protein